MGRIAFEEENVKKDASNFPRLKLELNGYARILMIEPEPWSEYVHNLRAPSIVNGMPVEETEEKDGVSTTSLKMEFIGQPTCLGDSSILDEDGADPKNCPACAKAKASDVVDAPKRRFAANVLRYAIKPGGVELQDPFRVDVVAWCFTDLVFGKLFGLRKDWGNLQEHDLKLGPCQKPVLFQKFDIQPLPIAEWQADPERRALAVATYKSNRADDDTLKKLCGFVITRDRMEADLAKVDARWKAASDYKRRSGPATLESAAALDTGLDDLLTAQTGSASPAPATTDAFADPQETKAAAGLGKPASSGESIKLDDLDDLLNV